MKISTHLIEAKTKFIPVKIEFVLKNKEEALALIAILNNYSTYSERGFWTKEEMLAAYEKNKSTLTELSAMLKETIKKVLI